MRSLKKQIGAIPFIGMLAGLSLSDWLIIGLVGFGTLQSIRLHFAKNEAVKWEQSYKTFVAGTEAAGKARVARNKAIEIERAAITKEVETHGKKLYDSLETEYQRLLATLDSERLRNKGAGGGQSTSLASTAGAIVCANGQADFDERVRRIEAAFEEFDRGNLERHYRGDKAIARTIVCDEWLTKQEGVKQ